MDEEKLFDLYEKLYFHEIDVRERLNSRLQIPLAIIALLFGFLAYMLQNKCSRIGTFPETIFWVFLSLSFIMVCFCILFFILSLYSFKHKLLPSAISTDQYKQELIEHYKDHEDPEKLVKKYLKQYLYDYYRDFSSENTIINDRKSFYLHVTNLFLIISLIFSFFTFIPYYFWNLDKSNFVEPLKVVIESPIIIDNHISGEKSKGVKDEQEKRLPPSPSSTTP